MKRIYHNFSLWEDCKNGILENNYNEKETEILTIKAKGLLCNPKKFYQVGINVINQWKFASEQHLSNTFRNRRAWIGQASCCYEFSVPEHITKYAWRLMFKKEQDTANRVADKIIKLWEEQHAKNLF